VYLKEIYLENFKSFGRKIRIPLLTGFTAITGPNGSGKSNIADAILFVLGPKSSKMIRAGKLTDLIFNGGNKKNPAKYCKVSLIFNNETRVIPIDTDEVRLTRLVKISPSNAENYYSYFYVNGKPSSLNEFENLLAHARISADGYNLVQQGDINRIIQMGKIDRRKIMDDIAGITKFDHDINKAEDKQGAVLENLDRIQILLEEIKNNLSRLKHDRNAAVKFKELKDQMNQAKAQIAHKRKEEVELKIISYTEQIKKFEADRISLNSKLEEYQQKFVEAENTLKELDDKIAEMGGDEAEELKVKIDELRLTQYKATDTIETSRSDIQTAKEEQSVLNRELKVVKKELQNLEKRQTEAANELEEINKVIKDSEAELKKQEEHRSKSSTEILELQREIGKLNQKIDSKHDDIKDRSLELDRAKEKLERMNSVITENQEVVNKTKFEIEELTWRIKDQEKKTKEEDSIINDLTEQYHQCKSKEKKLAKQAQELEEATNRLNREYMKLKAQKDAAESVQKNYSRTVERVLEARDRGLLRGIHGTIAELAEVDKEYERALTVAAGARMQSVVVDNDENASKAIEYLKSEKLGRATFLPLNKMLTGRPRAKALMCERNSKSLGFAIDLIKFDEKYRSAFWYVFGDTVIMEDLYSARKVMGGVRLVTKSGEVIEPSGAMVGGNIGSLNLRFGAPSESDFNNISELLRKSIEESERVSKELQTVRSEMTELEDKIRESNLSTGSTGFQVDDLKAKKKELSDKLKGLEKSFNEQLKDVEVETKNLSEMEGSLADANDEVEKLIQEREDKRELITKSTPQKLAEKINKLTEQLNIDQNTKRDLKAELKTLATQVEVYQSRREEFKEKLENIVLRIQENKNKIEEAKKVREQLNDELNTLLKVKDAMDQKYKDLKDKRDKLFQSRVKLESLIDTTNTKIIASGDLILKAQTNLQTVEDTIADIEAEIQNYENIELVRPIPPMDELNKTIQRLDIAMARLEPINMKAIEDYDIQLERKVNLEEEIKRLLEQQKDLLQIVDSLKKKKKEKLLVVFNGVNENFIEIYNELSAGGTAELLLENEDEPFEGGLIIKAKPPNKKLARLEALSGGEKSVVSMALIFAIQQFQPSPFYVLDEVDQNLDAINAEKVANMVRNDASTAQFLMISLRKVSLNRAHHVYGVTIQNNGITDIIGKINLNELGKEGKLLIKSETEIKKPDIDDTDTDSETELERGGMYG
jgi:chromosome segregation protein